MKQLNLRIKLTLWFLVVMIIIIVLTFLTVFKISESIIQKSIRDNLIETVENNLDEIEYFEYMPSLDGGNDQYIRFKDGYLEIDDDFLDSVNGVLTALYNSDSALLYGETPVYTEISDTPYINYEIQTVSVSKTKYYIFDRALDGDELDGLWLRGVVSENQGEQQLSSVIAISLVVMPVILIISIIGGYITSGRALKPIDKISDLASHISHGNDLKKRIELENGNDELHKLADVLNSMLERLDSAFETQRQFTSDVSHELRTPMSVISAQCELALEGRKSPEEYHNALQVIDRQSKKMSTLISDMLDYSRLEQNTYGYKLEKLDLSTLAKSVCTDTALIKDNGITLNFDIAPDIFVNGNTLLLTRLISNLISNAYKYGNPGGHINIALSETGANAVLAVSDDGIGISQSDIGKIFDRFYRADPSRFGKGTGLGLSIVKEIAYLHNGEITVDSELGRGSTFTFTLPKLF